MATKIICDDCGWQLAETYEIDTGCRCVEARLSRDYRASKTEEAKQ